MPKLKIQDLYSLEQYATIRDDFRAKVIAHKKHRHVAVGSNAAFYFEDAVTIQYQVQEMLRIERIFEAAAIQAELDVYNPLIPDGSNWKATFMLEYADVTQRRIALEQLIGIEREVYVQIGELERVFAICNEDLERTTNEKTSAINFMRFEFSTAMVKQAKAGTVIRIGIAHPKYVDEIILNDAIHNALCKDLL